MWRIMTVVAMLAGCAPEPGVQVELEGSDGSFAEWACATDELITTIYLEGDTGRGQWLCPGEPSIEVVRDYSGDVVNVRAINAVDLVIGQGAAESGSYSVTSTGTRGTTQLDVVEGDVGYLAAVWWNVGY